MADLQPAYPKQGVEQDAHTRAPKNFPGLSMGVMEDYIPEGSRANPATDQSWDKDKGDWSKDKYTMSPNELRKHMK